MSEPKDTPRGTELLRKAAVYGAVTGAAVFAVGWITGMGMGVDFGWLDHLLLALSEVALTVFFLMAAEPEPITEP